MDPGALPPPPAFIYEGSAVLCQDQRMLNNHFPIFPLVTSTLSTSAHGGDVSCSFESSRWDRDHCNWEYAFEAENLFLREFEPASDPMPSRKVWAHGNHYLKEEGPAYIRLQTKGDFLCSSISGEAPFGFDYKLTSGKVKNNIDFCIKNILCLIKDLQKNYHKNEDKTYRCCKADWILPTRK